MMRYDKKIQIRVDAEIAAAIAEIRASQPVPPSQSDVMRTAILDLRDKVRRKAAAGPRAASSAPKRGRDRLAVIS